jgi:type III secretion protein L
MTLFHLINQEKIVLSGKNKVISAEEFSKLMEAQAIIEKTRADAIVYREKVAEECELLKKEAEKRGFEEGLARFNEQLALLEEEHKKVRVEMEKALVPLAKASIKKIIGREMELKEGTFVDIIATSLRGISQYRRIKIFVNKNDLDRVERERQRLRELFDSLESLSILPREDIPENECVIETEAGIIHAGLESQLNALEKAFHLFLQKEKGG